MSSVIKTKEEFVDYAKGVRERSGFSDSDLIAFGTEMRTGNGILASARYHPGALNPTGQSLGTKAVIFDVLGDKIEQEFAKNGSGAGTITLEQEDVEKMLGKFNPFLGEKGHFNVDILKASLKGYEEGSQKLILTTIQSIGENLVGVPDLTLKLYGSSNRHFMPEDINYDNIFSKLPNVTWMSDGTVADSDELDKYLLEAMFGDVSKFPDYADKFPYLMDRVNIVKLGIRLTCKENARFGANIGKGAVFMKPGYANYNSSVGKDCTIEGSVSSGNDIGDNTQVGGGASFKGGISGGTKLGRGKTGPQSLFGSNSTWGISADETIGNVILAPTLTVMPGTKVLIDLPEDHPLTKDFTNGKVYTGEQLNNKVHDATFLPYGDGKVTARLAYTKTNEDKGSFNNAEIHKHQ